MKLNPRERGSGLGDTVPRVGAGGVVMRRGGGGRSGPGRVVHRAAAELPPLPEELTEMTREEFAQAIRDALRAEFGEKSRGLPR